MDLAENLKKEVLKGVLEGEGLARDILGDTGFQDKFENMEGRNKGIHDFFRVFSGIKEPREQKFTYLANKFYEVFQENEHEIEGKDISDTLQEFKDPVAEKIQDELSNKGLLEYDSTKEVLATRLLDPLPEKQKRAIEESYDFGESLIRYDEKLKNNARTKSLKRQGEFATQKGVQYESPAYQRAGDFVKSEAGILTNESAYNLLADIYKEKPMANAIVYNHFLGYLVDKNLSDNPVLPDIEKEFSNRGYKDLKKAGLERWSQINGATKKDFENMFSKKGVSDELNEFVSQKYNPLTRKDN